MNQSPTAESAVRSPQSAVRTPSRRRGTTRLLGIGALVAAVLAAGLVGGAMPHLRKERQAVDEAAAKADALPLVPVAVARRASATTDRVLPGNCLPLEEAALRPRTTGYLKSRNVDMGAVVKKGDLLAEIATPEVDAQLAQARAALKQTEANLVKNRADEAFARSEESRFAQLVRTSAASQEDYESKLSAARVTAATVQATEATLDVNRADILRLETMQGFQKITAPFDGVITARNFDPGSLVTADSPGTTKELFHLMRLDTVRVWVNVPQPYAPGIKVGQEAKVFRREEPTRTFKGTVTRTANSLDPATRTLLAEVQVPNPNGTLLPGMYLQVKFALQREAPAVLIPAAALVTRAEGTQVAVLGSGNAMHYRKVQVGRDFGADIEIEAGLKEGETVIVRPGDDLPDGTVVQPATAQK